MSAQFDTYAEDYEAALERGVSLSGEDSSYFARVRVQWLGERIAQLGAPSRTLLDFGCGTGSTAPILLGLAGAERVIGTDISAGLLDVARREHGADGVEFIALDDPPAGQVDVAYCNGVLHHIVPAERAAALAYVRDSLRPGGLFALWENNPWNPGTRAVMRRIPFDHDAVTLSAPVAQRTLRTAGFAVVRTDFLFIFPHALRTLRGLERRFVRLPLGAQYLVLARRV